MTWSRALVCLVLASTTVAINRPVYKIVLTQKGFTQFLQYDLETPPLREFTFCTWIRIYDLAGDQSVFTYVANGNNRVVRLWLDSGGRNMKLSINGRVTSSTPVEIVKDVWRHVCLSYQSDYGAWAIYLDSKLVMCELAQSLAGFVLPKGGSLIIGYGTTDDGGSTGIEGEIFGANMILTSTIERNVTKKFNSLYDQKAFNRNKVKSPDKNINYIILGDLQTDSIHNNFEKSQEQTIQNKTKSHIQFQTPYSNFEHSVGLQKATKISNVLNNKSSEKEIFDFPITENISTTDKSKIHFWNLVNKAGHEGKFKEQKKNKQDEISGSGTQDLATISEYETPPPPPGLIGEFHVEKTTKTSPIPKSIFNITPLVDEFNTQHLQNKNKVTPQLPDVDTPPPLPEKYTKVYGQWTSSKFAGSVLNYLKSINFNNKKERKTPSTIPLNKVSDSYPYASDFKLTKLRPPVQFQRRNLIDRNIRIRKRGITNQPQINVQILEDDLRDTIIKLHAETQAKNVEVTNRGQTVLSNRFYRNVDHQVSVESSESIENIFKPRPFKLTSVGKNKNELSDFDRQRNSNLMTILPFLKSLEYFVEDSQNTGSDNVEHSTDMYSKSLSNANKWHNVKSYNNDYTPRRINVDSDQGKSNIEAKIAEANLKQPSIRLKYKHENHKIVQNKDDPTILKGRKLALSVSNQSNANKESISIIKYNHGFLPSHDTKMKNTEKNSEKTNSVSKKNNRDKRLRGKDNFNKHVKIGNALNERDVIGYNEEYKKQSFVGGDDKIPDINRYRSDLDSENINVPSSLGPRVCKDVGSEDHVLYVQQDQSIDRSHILSPVKKRNIAVDFIEQNYNKCSLVGSKFENNYLLLIDWSKTPVRLFGGAYAKTTTDLCGFFK